MTDRQTAALAAAIGGALWVAKGGYILATGDEPDVLAFLFVVAAFFFGTCVALLAIVLARVSRAARWGGVIGLGAAVIAPVAATLDAADAGLAANVLIALSYLGVLAALVLYGAAARRRGPLALAAGFFLANAAAAGLEAVSPRLFELPTVALGAGWIAFAYALAR